jgi:hypothetical protein
MSSLFKVLILVCSVNQTPQDCQPDTALDLIIGPPAANELVCARDGQAYVANTPLVVAGETYPKILCTRSDDQNPGSELATAKLPTRPGQPHGWALDPPRSLPTSGFAPGTDSHGRMDPPN